MILFLRRIRRDQANNNSRDRNFSLHANNLGFPDIGVLKGRHTRLNFSMKMRVGGRSTTWIPIRGV